MVRRRYFAHVSPGGESVADRVCHTGYLSGAGDWTLGEDIGWGTGEARRRKLPDCRRAVRHHRSSKCLSAGAPGAEALTESCGGFRGYD
jgi:hypothetical protein